MAPKRLLIGLTLAAAAGLANADTLLLDGVEMDSQTATSRPGRGTAMERVESTYGTPAERFPAIGEPPITRWEYPGFTVYFEHNLVIHTVVRR